MPPGDRRPLASEGGDVEPGKPDTVKPGGYEPADMDECPRCGATLEYLSLGEVTTVSCGRCGYADVPVDHQPEREKGESWREALQRFYG